MTDLATEPAADTTAPTASSAWDANFRALRSRFPKSNDSILFCLHELQQNDTMPLEGLKALASMHGIRITGASVTAARRLMAPGAPRVVRRRRSAVAEEVKLAGASDGAAPRDGLPLLVDDGPGVAAAAVAGPVRRPRSRRPELQGDLGDMVLQAVQQAAGDAEAKAERLREAVRRAIEVLREAVG